MSESFLAKFMQTVKGITGAKRLMAVDNNMNLVETINLEPEVLESAQFSELAYDCLNRAIEQGEPIITNNIITDPTQAPVTNTNFSDLRVIVAFPVSGHGAIYLDQHIRYGIISRETTDKLMHLVNHIIKNNLTDSKEADFLELYQELG